jgi:TolB-like protein
MPDVFLSYNRDDAAVAKLMADAFAREGLEVWWDVSLRSGEAYDRVTEEALRTAKAVVVLWSPRSVDSRWVRAEASIADENATLVPAKIDACQLPVMFRLTQTADLSHWHGETGDTAWQAFLGDVQRMVAGEVPANPGRAPQLSSAILGTGIPIVAVLPIAHRAGDDELEILGEDLTDEVTREMARSRYFEVIAAGTMGRWRGIVVDHRELRRELGAVFAVECKLQRSGEDVRLTVQVIDCETGRMLWSGRLMRKAADVAVAPEVFAVLIASELGEQIVQIEVTRAMAHPGPFSTWQHMMRSMAYVAHTGSDSIRRAIEEARCAITAAPDAALAHAMLATNLALLVNARGKELDDALSREIQAHIQRAIQLDGDDPTVIAWLVSPHITLGDFEAALRLAQRTVELYPGSPRSHWLLGFANLELGRTAEAIAAFTEELRLTTHDPIRNTGHAYLGVCYLLEGRPEEAEAAIDRSLALRPDLDVTLKWKAIVAASRGNEELALATVRRLREVEPEMTIEQHVRQVTFSPNVAERSGEYMATLQRLWVATGNGR